MIKKKHKINIGLILVSAIAGAAIACVCLSKIGNKEVYTSSDKEDEKLSELEELKKQLRMELDLELYEAAAITRDKIAVYKNQNISA